MSNDENGGGFGDSFFGALKLLKQIISRLRDPAALFALALFLLAVCAGSYIGNYWLTFGFALLFLVIYLLYRCYLDYNQTTLNAMKLDNDLATKLKNIEKSNELKMTKLKIRAIGRNPARPSATNTEPSEAQLPLQLPKGTAGDQKGARRKSRAALPRRDAPDRR